MTLWWTGTAVHTNTPTHTPLCLASLVQSKHALIWILNHFFYRKHILDTDKSSSVRPEEKKRIFLFFLRQMPRRRGVPFTTACHSRGDLWMASRLTVIMPVNRILRNAMTFFFFFKNDLIFQWTSLNDDSVTGLVCNMSENRQKILINCFPGSKHLFYFDSTLSKSVDLHGGRHKLDVYCWEVKIPNVRTNCK